MKLDPRKYYWVKDCYGDLLVTAVFHRAGINYTYPLACVIKHYVPREATTPAPVDFNNHPLKESELVREATPEEIMRALL